MNRVSIALVLSLFKKEKALFQALDFFVNITLFSRLRFPVNGLGKKKLKLLQFVS